MQLQQHSIDLKEEPDTECQHGISPVRNARLEHTAKKFLTSGFASFAVEGLKSTGGGMLSFCKTASDLQIIGGVDCRQQGCQASVHSLKVEHLRTSRATSAADLIVEGALKKDGRSRLLIQTLKDSYRAQTD